MEIGILEFLFFHIDKIIFFCYAIWAVKIGMSPSGKATDFDSVMRWFESSHPSHFEK